MSVSLAPASSLRLLGQLGWYGAAELAGRISRLAATIVLARLLDSAALGTAAAALTMFELIRVLANNGLGQAVIRAPAAALEATCNTARRLAWILCGGLALLQVALGLGLHAAGIGGESGPMLAALAGVYLLMAPGLVPVYLLLREGRMRVTASIAAAQVMTDNLLTIILVAAGCGAWGVVLPKLLVAPIWLIGVRRAMPWRALPSAGFAPVRPLLGFAVPLLGSEILATARMNLDNLLVGLVLGIEALGLYYFVFNAGIGFSLSLTNAIATVAYPHLARAGSGVRQALDHLARRILPGAAALIALQAVAATLYVPVVFGDRWAEAAPLVALLCASAIARPFADAAAQAMRAAGRTVQELRWASLGTAAWLGAFAIALPFGLPVAIATLTIVATLLQAGFFLLARRSLA